MTRMTARSTGINWHDLAARRAAELDAFAAERSVAFSTGQTRRLIAVSLREDARRATQLADALVRLARGW